MNSTRLMINPESPSLGQWAILASYRGSISQGMYVHPSAPTSIDDKDIIACCVPPIEYFFGIQEFGLRGVKEIKQGEWDVVLFGFRKYVSLLALGHPNVLPMLWLEPEFYVKIAPAGQLLLDNRHLFVGRHAYKAFTVYAKGLLHRSSMTTSEGYLGEKRHGLVRKFGYDTNCAEQLIRLQRMAAEFMKDGELHVKRRDADQLLAIKRGEWSLAQVQAEAERGFQRAERAYLESKLREYPDTDAINRLSIAIVDQALSARGEH